MRPSDLTFLEGYAVNAGIFGYITCDPLVCSIALVAVSIHPEGVGAGGMSGVDYITALIRFWDGIKDRRERPGHDLERVPFPWSALRGLDVAFVPGSDCCFPERKWSIG